MSYRCACTYLQADYTLTVVSPAGGVRVVNLLGEKATTLSEADARVLDCLVVKCLAARLEREVWRLELAEYDDVNWLEQDKLSYPAGVFSAFVELERLEIEIVSKAAEVEFTGITDRI